MRIIASVCSKYYQIIFAAILCLSSCKDNPSIEEIPVINVNLNHAENILASEVFDSISILPIDKDLNKSIGQINKLIETEESYYLLDEDFFSSVYILDKSGSLVGFLSPSGDGPEEFNQVSDMAFDQDLDRLHLFASSDGKVISYDKRGNFQSEKYRYLYSDDFAFLSENKNYVFYTANQVYENIQRKLLYLDSGLNVTSSYLPIQKPYDKIFHGLTSHFSNPLKGNLLFVDSFNDTIYSVESNGIKPSMIVDFGKHRLLTADIGSQPNSSDVLKYAKTKDKAFIYGGLLQNDKYIYFYSAVGEKVFATFHNKITKTTTVIKSIEDDFSGLYIFPFLDLKSSHFTAVMDKEYLSVIVEGYQKINKQIPENITNILTADHNFYIIKYWLKQ